MSDSNRVDLRILDPRLDPDRWERMVRGIMRGASDELLRRRRRTYAPTPMDGLVALLRPALAAAAILAAISVAALRHADGNPTHPGSFVESSLLPEPITIWLEDGAPPTASDLYVTANGDL